MTSAVDHSPGLVERDASVAVDAEADDLAPAALQPGAGAGRRRVLDGGGDEPSVPLQRLENAADGEVVRLRATGGEEDLLRVAPERGGDLLSRAGDGVPGADAVGVGARRVSEVLAKERQHRVDDLGEEGSRRVVVQVDGVHEPGGG